MNKTKSLAAQVAGAVAIVTLIGTSAFAESRHHDATEHDGGRQSDHRSSRDSSRQSRGEQRDNRSNQGQTWQRNDSRSASPRTYERGDNRSNSAQSYRDSRSYGQSYSSRGNTYDRRTQADSSRNNRGSFDRSQSFRGNRPSFDDRGRRSVTLNGRVNRFVHERGGYRVWIDGGGYPIWIPEARIGLFPHLRVGLSLGFGGYYDPAGYLDAYDYYDGGYGGGYNAGVTAYSSGLLRGTVESVDYRNGTLVLRDDVTGNFVTTLIRDRRLESLRPGDYAEISGSWTRSGVFDGLRLEDEQGGRY
jgi:hypothetical protein